MSSTNEKMTQIRDPLFVIGASLEIIRQRANDSTVEPEIQRIKSALAKIEQIIQT